MNVIEMLSSLPAMTEEERKKCQRVADVFNPIVEQEGNCVADAGRFGFVYLELCREDCPNNFAFDWNHLYFTAEDLFDELINDVVNWKIHQMARDTPLVKLELDELYEVFNVNENEEFINLRTELFEKCFS
ncbi:MAG: hypothetical protein IJP31_01435 [Lachnospiraceae bacterium]|nr:hypothetical protein [Lachnospiraceae bacterium]